MTVPEENRWKNSKTEDAGGRPEKLREDRERGQRAAPAEGATMREALEEANVSPEDYEEEGR